MLINVLCPIRQMINKRQKFIQALWSDNKEFNEILISPTMIKDHMPDQILEALQSLLQTTGPPKPQRNIQNNNVKTNDNSAHHSLEASPCKTQPSNTSSSHTIDISKTSNIIVETSFTDAFHISEHRLQQLRSHICRGVAPLATPESGSLESVPDSIFDHRNSRRSKSSVRRKQPISVIQITEPASEPPPPDLAPPADREETVTHPLT